MSNAIAYVQLRLHPTDRDRIAKCAQVDHRSISAWVRLVVMQAVLDSEKLQEIGQAAVKRGKK